MPAPVVAPRPLRRRGAGGVPVVADGTPVNRWLPTLVTAALAVAASVVATLVVVTGDVWSYSPAPQLLVDAAVGLGFPVIAQGLDDFVELVIPVLEARGVYDRTLPGATLRDHLGLARRESRYAAPSDAPFARRAG